MNKKHVGEDLHIRTQNISVSYRSANWETLQYNPIAFCHATFWGCTELTLDEKSLLTFIPV